MYSRSISFPPTRRSIRQPWESVNRVLTPFLSLPLSLSLDNEHLALGRLDSIRDKLFSLSSFRAIFRVRASKLWRYSCAFSFTFPPSLSLPYARLQSYLDRDLSSVSSSSSSSSPPPRGGVARRVFVPARVLDFRSRLFLHCLDIDSPCRMRVHSSCVIGVLRFSFPCSQSIIDEDRFRLYNGTSVLYIFVELTLPNFISRLSRRGLTNRAVTGISAIYKSCKFNHLL